MSVNKIIIMGHLGRDPETKVVNGSKQVCKFSVCTVHRITTSEGEKKSLATWHNVDVWGKMAELCQRYITKGSHVYIEGKQENEFYDTGNGEKKLKSWVTCKYVEFLDRQEDRGNTTQVEQQQSNFNTEDIPF